MDSLGERLRRLLESQYSVDREIGRGGMATVYLARDVRHRRAVAIKLLQPELTTPVTAERFLREIQITAKLQHPHILTLIDSGARDGLAYYVMPHVEGESLRERLVWEKQLTIDQAVQIAKEVASALEYAHRNGVVHRDIKPENILLSAGHAIVADFGIARAMLDSNQQAITQVGLPLGTPAYMSPEQIDGREDIDHRTDVYSLGCVLFEMVAGRPPFVAGSVSQVLQAHLMTRPPAVCEHCSGAPAELDQVLEKALAKDPGQRFQSARELVDALEFVGAVETLERATPTGQRRRATAPQTVLPDRGQTPVSLKKLLILAGMAGAVVLAIVGARRLLQTANEVALAPGQVLPGPSTPFLTSVGVKPLDAIGNDSSARVASAGITAELTARLGQIKGLKVISRTSMEAVQTRQWTSRTIADSLGVRFLLEGSVQRSDRELGVTLQLIDVVNDAHVWSDSYRLPLRDLLMIRDDIATKAVVALAGRVPGLAVVAHDSVARNPMAVEARARGLEFSTRTTEHDIGEAIKAYERALELDPDYAEAAAELADVLRYYADLGFGTDREPYETMRQALRWARRAVRLDPDLATAYAARGAIQGELGLSSKQALADLERAVALAPASGRFRVFRAIGLAHEGRYDEALNDLAAATSLDPLNAVLRGGGVALTALGARRYDIAEREAGLAIARDPDFGGWVVIQALARGLGGDWTSCAAAPLPDPGAPVRALCLLRSGHEAEGRAVADSSAAEALAGRASVYVFGMLGAYHAQRGETRAALEWLERGFAISPVAFDFRFLDSGLFDPVRDDPAFDRGMSAIMGRVRARVGGATGR